ncbi:NUDIX hydrolase [Leisingera sp. ANG-M1]|nr:NUDIX hydrolase [Leisingera sp. ANG-M1]
MAEIPVRSSLVFLFVLRAAGAGHQVLLLKRTQTLAGEWSQVSGRIEGEEKAWETALRELKEEAGLEAERLFATDICETYYGVTQNVINIAPVFVAFVSETAEVALNFEHSAYHWAGFEEAGEMVPYGGQRRTLRQIEEEFSRRSPCRHFEIDISKTTAGKTR